MQSWDPICDTAAFPYFHELCEPIRKKYGSPYTYWHNSGIDGGGRPGIKPEMDAEYNAAVENAKAWLKKMYPKECSEFVRSYAHWSGLRPSPPERGLDGWLADETAPAPHGGWPGCQWAWDTSPAGRMSKITPALCRAYQICVQKRKETDAAAEAAKQKKLQLATAAQRFREAEDSRKADMRRVWIQRLCDSLSMHYFPVRVIKGARRPAEWLPAFNQEVLDRMDRTFEKALANEIYAEAFAVSKSRADEMIRKHREEEEAAELAREKRRARLLAEAMLEAQAARAAPAVPEIAAPVVREEHEFADPVVHEEPEIADPVAREEHAIADPVARHEGIAMA